MSSSASPNHLPATTDAVPFESARASPRDSMVGRKTKKGSLHRSRSASASASGVNSDSEGTSSFFSSEESRTASAHSTVKETTDKGVKDPKPIPNGSTGAVEAQRPPPAPASTKQKVTTSSKTEKKHGDADTSERNACSEGLAHAITLVSTITCLVALVVFCILLPSRVDSGLDVSYSAIAAPLIVFFVSFNVWLTSLQRKWVTGSGVARTIYCVPILWTIISLAQKLDGMTALPWWGCFVPLTALPLVNVYLVMIGALPSGRNMCGSCRYRGKCALDGIIGGVLFFLLIALCLLHVSAFAVGVTAIGRHLDAVAGGSSYADISMWFIISAVAACLALIVLILVDSGLKHLSIILFILIFFAPIIALCCTLASYFNIVEQLAPFDARPSFAMALIPAYAFLILVALFALVYGCHAWNREVCYSDCCCFDSSSYVHPAFGGDANDW